jgi:hypothetical protein
MAQQRQTPIEHARAQCGPGELACEICLRIRPSRMMAKQGDGRLACPICVADGRAVDTRESLRTAAWAANDVDLSNEQDLTRYETARAEGL